MKTIGWAFREELADAKADAKTNLRHNYDGQAHHPRSLPMDAAAKLYERLRPYLTTLGSSNYYLPGRKIHSRNGYAFGITWAPKRVGRRPPTFQEFLLAYNITIL